jgi:hypothetical protein
LCVLHQNGTIDVWIILATGWWWQPPIASVIGTTCQRLILATGVVISFARCYTFLGWIDKDIFLVTHCSFIQVLVEVSHLPQLFVLAQEWFALPHQKLHQGWNVTPDLVEQHLHLSRLLDMQPWVICEDLELVVWWMNNWLLMYGGWTCRCMMAYGTYFWCNVDELCMMDNGCIHV